MAEGKEGGHNFSWGGQEGLPEKVMYEQRPKGGERRSHLDTRERAFCRGNRQCVGPEASMPGVLEEDLQGPCGWSKVGQGESGDEAEK